MRQYDLMLVLRPDFEAKDVKPVEELVAKFLGEASTVTEVVVVGKKPFSYPIKHQTEGLYVSAKVASDAIRTDEVEKRMKLSTDILRYLLTVRS